MVDLIRYMVSILVCFYFADHHLPALPPVSQSSYIFAQITRNFPFSYYRNSNLIRSNAQRHTPFPFSVCGVITTSGVRGLFPVEPDLRDTRNMQVLCVSVFCYTELHLVICFPTAVMLVCLVLLHLLLGTQSSSTLLSDV